MKIFRTCVFLGLIGTVCNANAVVELNNPNDAAQLNNSNTVQPLNTIPSNPSNRSQDDFWKQQYIENQKQQLELEKQKFKYKKKLNKQQARQQRIMQLQQNCSEQSFKDMNLALCNAIANNVNYGTPITDEQLGLKTFQPAAVP